MITLEEWEKLVHLKNEAEDFINNLYKLQLDLTESPLYSTYIKLLNILIKVYTNPKFVDLVNWWLFGDIDKVLNINGTDIDVSSTEGFYNWIKNNGGWND